MRKVLALAVTASIACVGAALAQDTGVGVGSAALNPNGSARLPVTVGAPGTLVIRDLYADPQRVCSPPKRIKTLSTEVTQPGLVELQVIPVGKAKRKIKAGKKVKVVAQVAFTPASNPEAVAVQQVSIKLRKAGQAVATQSVHLARAACATPPPH